MPSEVVPDLRPLLEDPSFAVWDDRAFLRITGSDATRWLNGMVTNAIQALEPGRGCYNFLLSAQGRILGDCTIFREPGAVPPSFLLETDQSQVETIHELFDRFIIMDDVEIERLGYTSGLLLLAPQGVDLVSLPGDQDGRLNYEPYHLYALSCGPATTAGAGLFQQARVATASVEQTEELAKGLRLRGVREAGPELLEASRILEGRPRYGVDICSSENAKVLPQETNQSHALNFSKGCYVGQEIVERIRSRGQVHRLFTPFRLDGALPEEFPMPLAVEGRPAGELTSAVRVADGDGSGLLALGYARREFLVSNATFEYRNGTALVRLAGKMR